MNNCYLIKYQITTNIVGRRINVLSYSHLWAIDEYNAAYLLGRESKNVLFKNHIFDEIMSNENLRDFMIEFNCYVSDIIDFDLRIIEIRKIGVEVK